MLCHRLPPSPSALAMASFSRCAEVCTFLDAVDPPSFHISPLSPSLQKLTVLGIVHSAWL